MKSAAEVVDDVAGLLFNDAPSAAVRIIEADRAEVRRAALEEARVAACAFTPRHPACVFGVAGGTCAACRAIRALAAGTPPSEAA